MGTGDCTAGEGEAIVDGVGEVIPGGGDVSCEFCGEEIFLGAGEARMLLAGDEILCWELMAGAGEERLRGAGLEVLEFGFM